MIGRAMAILAILAAVGLPGGARLRQATAASPARWECEDRPMLLGERLPGFPAKIGGAGTAFPDGTLVLVGIDLKARKLKLFLYPGEVMREVALDAIALEHPSRFPTGRFDPTGEPVAVYHENQVKVFIPNWGGDGGAPTSIYRLYTWCAWR